VADDFTQRYGDLLTGSYDCVDRIVLNAYFPLGHSPGGFRTWWRRLHQGSDERLDDTHLMRIAGRLARRVKAWAAANGVPLIYGKAGDRKHQIAADYLRAHSVGPGVFLILVAKAPAPVWKVERSGSGAITALEKKTEYVNHYSFHIMDPAWGHLVIKMSGHPPFGAQIILNGHEYVACAAHAAGIAFAKEDNCFTGIADPQGLAQIADASPRQGPRHQARPRTSRPRAARRRSPHHRAPDSPRPGHRPDPGGVRAAPAGHKPARWTGTDRDYEAVRADMQAIFRRFGIIARPAAA
jgi:hypothetical protein